MRSPLVLLLLLGLAGCEVERQEAVSTPATPDDSVAVIADSVAATSAPAGAPNGAPSGRPARVTLAALGTSGVAGTVTLTPVADGLQVDYDITGLTPGAHGFHVHQNGDCGAADLPDDPDTDPNPGGAAGPHFAPGGTPHGAQDAAMAARHAGDFGNVEAGADGRATGRILDRVAVLDGEASIVGKAVLVHANPDDLATQPSGNAGARVACGLIERP